MFSNVWKKLRFGEMRAAEIVQVSKRELASKKTSRSKMGLLVKTAFVVELGIFIGSYLVWKRMNSSQDFRFYMRNNYPQILEGICGLKAFSEFNLF